MGMGRREQQRRQEELWIAHPELPRTVAHPFYEPLNRVLEARAFDAWVEQPCARFYAERMGRPSLAPGRYFRLLLIGYFEGIDSERGIAWRVADSLGLRSFLGVGLNEMPPDHSTISRTRRLIDVETHQALFRGVLELLGKRRRTTVLTSDEVVSTSFVNGHDLLSGCVCYWVESSAAESFNPRFQGNNSAIRLTGWSAMRSST